MTPSQRVVLEVLGDGQWHDTSEIVDRLYGDREDGGPLMAQTVVGQFVHRLRRAGVDIEGRLGARGGYRLRPSTPPVLDTPEALAEELRGHMGDLVRVMATVPGVGTEGIISRTSMSKSVLPVVLSRARKEIAKHGWAIEGRGDYRLVRTEEPR